jgi:N,N-dimethylformamidase
MAYANERFYAGDLQDWSLTSDRELTLSRQDEYLASHPELGISLYDVHSDGSGVACFSSRLRPILNMRPKMTSYWTGGGRHFCADLYLTYWLEEKGFGYDVITDEDLHASGLDLVSGYRTVITGSHPEYWTWEMRKAIDAYLQQGGRLMYLGGNGAWWVTAIDKERPHLMEVRKDDYTQSTPQLGVNGAELHLSSTGERGGTWRSRGLDPAEIFGVSLTGEGWDHAGAYRRTRASEDERVAFVFDGVAKDEIIGDVGLALGGAAGDEYDRVDFLYGSPPHTLILASSFGHSDRDKRFGDAYQPVEVREARVRSDIAYFELQDGGAVFAAGSVSWTAALPHNGCDNPVSKITENVLRRFSEEHRKEAR